jgi:CDP-2,3-bis-(O-geranylgeranyl)-sn-glycerol synthase
MHLIPIVQGLILVLAANGAPVLATRAFGPWGAAPLDFGARWLDGEPLLGHSKTIRGVLASLLAAALAAPLLGLGWRVGALAAGAAMAGDLLSSFIKRRLKLAPHSMAPGLDQAPESLLPLIVCAAPLGLTLADVLVATLVFWIGELALSRALFSLKIRERPY